MSSTDVYVETGVTMAYDSGAAAWVFSPDLQPATTAEVRRTLEILAQARSELLELLAVTPDSALDRVVDQAAHFARWSTVRERVWHIADTESRYYLPAVGLPSKPRAESLVEELRESAEHVDRALSQMPLDIRTDRAGERWSSVKLLRRLAWHEPGELAVIREALAD